MENVENIIEAIMFALGRKVSVDELSTSLDISKEEAEVALGKLVDKYSEDKSGISLVKVKNSYQLVTNNKYYEYICKFVNSNKKENLSNSCMEVLSIIAYNSNITKAEIESIRGVNSDSQVSRLLEYGLVEEVGRLKVPGRPAVFSVTDEFLKCMKINTIEELPEYENIAKKDNENLEIEE